MKNEKELWELNTQRAKQLYTAPKDVFKVNIGGTHKVISTKATLCKVENSALAAMFSGRHKVKTHKGRIFIDRDGEAFCMMISYLRTGKIPMFADKTQENLFYEELDYWQIPVKMPAEAEEFPEFDPLWCASTLRLESNSLIVRKHGPQHGVVFCKRALDNKTRYIEFKVIMNPPIRSRSSLFVGLVDRSRYRPEQLVSTFWKDSPSSYYCDVWNNKLIKIDEHGSQTGVAPGYGCECQDSEVNTVAMEYDYQKMTLSYYKNGICQGVAFHNVPNGLYPSIDLWFESGNVEILNKRQPAMKDHL